MSKKVIKILMILLIIILVLTKICYTAEINTDAFKDIYDSSNTGKIKDLGGKVLGVVQIVSVATGVIMLIILGIKYMISSVEEKATIKQKLVPYVIGAFLIFAGTTFLQIIQGLANTF